MTLDQGPVSEAELEALDQFLLDTEGIEESMGISNSTDS